MTDTTQTYLATARRVVSQESAALNLLADTLDDAFVQAVQMILDAPGRVIVSGMGKSGHVGRKIAATLASTGTPAFFVHPAEASHGDLGMISEGDVALVLSNSGETAELSDIIAYTRRFAIPMIGVASKADSTLLRQSDIALVLPAAEEACTIKMAPTTSTTMTLALGDALAVVLMEHRQFTAEKYSDYHPGGKIGARLTRVRDLMHTGDALPLVSPDTAMTDALLVMSQKSFGVVGITCPDGTLQGIITDGDLRRHMDGLLTHRVQDVMTANPRTIRPGALVQEALSDMTLKSPKVTCLFVVDPEDGNRVQGLLHIHDCLRAGAA